MTDKKQENPKPPKEVFKVADFLLSDKSGLRKREGVINGARSGVNALVDEVDKRSSYCENREQAAELLSTLLEWEFIARCEKNQGDPRSLRPSALQTFNEEYYYVWVYEGSKLRIILGAISLVLIVLAGVMFPLWPSKLRVGSWYLSMGALGLIGLLFVIAIIRLIIYVISIFVAPPGLWIFPNLFEDVGFFDSFVPLYAWDVPKNRSRNQAQDAEPQVAEPQAAKVLEESQVPTGSNTRSNVQQRKSKGKSKASSRVEDE
ncbi:hypothetical protein BB560_003426 [Smittium megazygosporum]|uniref:Translocation protein SEC62 n=1 Tax=Smittium megazygosporum TaxID=133381 RepID=A0A2T9ZC55_9FUNG|nr:hypothetical protein BB560_003426 [Smittium megazygosporum]